MKNKLTITEITHQVGYAVSFPEPKRSELFREILAAVTDKKVKANIELIQDRITRAGPPMKDFTNSEAEYYQSCFADHFYLILHSEKFTDYIEEKIKELHFFSKRIEIDLKTKEYEEPEDKDHDISNMIEADRQKIYFQNLLERFATPADDGISHRVHIMVNQFKAQAGIEEKKTPQEWRAERGNKANQAYYTLNYSKNYKAPKEKELNTVIDLLKDFPNAQKLAINKRDEIINS
jgi:hypothetical protein